jgi:signal transduction histidine kinase
MIIFVIINFGIVITSTISTISSYIAEVINEHSWQIRSIADRIMKSGNSPDKIHKIITSSNKLDTESNFNQFLNQKDLFWVDADDNVIIKNKVGILGYPYKVPKSYEVFNARENNWKLIISKESPFTQKDYTLILTSFGVTDNNGKYIGSIVSSIDVNLIQNLLIKNSPNKFGDVIILNSHTNKIVSRSNPERFDDTDFFTHKLGNIDYNQNQIGQISDEIQSNGIIYNHYKKLTDYPFVILSGYDSKLYRSQLIRLIIKTIYPNITVGFVLLIILFLFYKRIVKPIKNLSQIARKIGSGNYVVDFPKKINSPEIFDLAKALLRIKYQRIRLEKSNAELISTKNQLEEAIEIIKKSDVAQIEIVKQVRKEIFKNTAQAFHVINMIRHNLSADNGRDNKMNLLLIKNIEQEIINITNFATDELNKEYADIYHIIGKVVLSQQKEIKIRNIQLDVSYSQNLPKKVFVDQIRLIQILSGILSKTISLLSASDQVRIKVKIIAKNKTKFLAIKIRDNGIGIGFKEHLQDAERFGGREESAINGIDISTDTIEELVKLHNGEIVYNNKIQQGSSTMIILPYIKKVKKITPASTVKKTVDNVIYLPIKSKETQN